MIEKQYAGKLAVRARKAGGELRKAAHTERKAFLKSLSSLILTEKGNLLKANAKDLENGERVGLSSAMLDRLKLDEKRLRGIASGVRQIAALPDPLGREISRLVRKDGLVIGRRTVPIGAILFIFESRPNVTVDGAALCVKSGNAVILRGGRESASSNLAFSRLIRRALSENGLPVNAVQLVTDSSYGVVDALLLDSGNIDLVIPRGGEKLITSVVDKSRIPVIKHYKGVCHVYMDKSADVEKAEAVILNAKIQRPGVCNAMETLLLDGAVPQTVLKRILIALKEQGVAVRGCPSARKILPGIARATRRDWDEEYLDLSLAVRIVNGVQGAIDHIRRHGSGHTDAVLARDKDVCDRFLNEVDSSSVMVNASTRFSDGSEYGLGAEVGISTDKLHARGPMGIESLTTYQWRVTGNGHCRT